MELRMIWLRLHMSSDDVIENTDRGGRPPEGIKYGQHNNAFGMGSNW